MQNLDGSLGFKATLDIDDFNVSSEAIERRIKKVANNVEGESGKMEDSLLSFAQNGAKYIVSYLVGQGMGSLLNSIVQTRGQFQQLEIAFETILGSGSKATALMNQLVDTAARTPFDLMGVASSAKQLLAYGIAAEDVNDTLVRLGNIASGLSIPLQDIAYLYGTTMTQGRLYAQDLNQFTGRGIPMVKELAKILGVAESQVKTLVSEGKVGFPEVQQVIQNLTNEGGMFFNLMEKQSKSLTGMIANLGDAWDSALNKLGEDNQDVFAAGISGATYLVEHLDDILRIVKAITVAYGSYKAAIVLNTLATKGYTGVAILDNTVRQAKIALLKVEAVATQGVTAATKALWATMKANPVGWIISLLGAALSVLTLFGKKEEEITEDQVGLANATKKAGEEFATQASKVDALQKILNDSNQTYSERIKALKELKEIVPGYNAELTQEGEIISNNTKAIQDYLTKLEKQIKLKAAQEELEAAYREKRLKEKEIIQKQSAYDTASAQVPDVAYGDAGANYQLYMLRQAGKAEKQLKQAQRELTGINKTIEELNQEINTTSLSLDDSTGTTKTYTEQVQETKIQIASLTKELEDLRSGKVTKDNLAQEIEDKTRELNTAKKNLELLTGEKTGTASTGDQYSQKRLEAEIKLEEDRISVMEDGYAKRKALLDLQHKKNLAQIDKEEKELLEARKKANKGGLSQSEATGFQERRSLEKQNYNSNLVDLFDEEIAYRKKQYQLYYRWVENMGKQVADTQFATLLKEGNSYSQWVNQEIARLEAKRNQDPNAFTSGDQQNLFSLTVQRDEISGKRSAMDAFRESIAQTINQATTLAAKIEAIAKAKESLAKSTSLNPDEKLEIQNDLDSQDREAQKELNQAILADFKSYEEKKREITANYNAMRLSDIAQNNADLLARINEGEKAALSALQAEQLQASTDWKNLFQNLDTLTSGEIQKLITSIENQMANADLKLSPTDYQAMIDSLNKAKEKVTELNPFNALGKAFDNYIQACKKLKRAEQDNLTDDKIKALEKQVETSAKLMTASIQSINQVVGAVGDSMASLASSFGAGDLADTISGVTDVLGGAGQTAMGVGQIMSGDLLGGITSVIGGITSMITAFNQMHDARMEEQIKGLREQVDQLASAYDDLGDAIVRAYSTDKASLLEQQNKNLEQQNEQIRQQIQAEMNKKDTDWDLIKEWEELIAENEKKISENAKYNIIEALTGTDIMSAIDDLSAAYADAWTAGETAAGKSADTVKKLIRTAIIEQLKGNLKTEVEKFMTYLADAMKDGVISEAEERMLEQMEEDMEEISDNYLSKNEKWMRDDKEEESQDPLTGAVRSMSEETGGVIAGRMNAIVINQSDQMAIMRNQLIYQAEIAANTRVSAERLGNIENTLKRIETKDSSLLSQGIS